MSNALGCYLGPDVIRGLGINSGTLYQVDDGMGGPPDFDYAPDGGVLCPPGTGLEVLPATIIVWGTADVGEGTEYNPNGLGTLDQHRKTQGCSATTTAGPHPPCVIYTGCTRTVQWCAIDGMPHDLWRNPPYPGDGAPAALATFFGSLP